MLINYNHTSFNNLDYKHRIQIIYPIFYILLYAMNACTRSKPYQNNMWSQVLDDLAYGAWGSIKFGLYSTLRSLYLFHRGTGSLIICGL